MITELPESSGRDIGFLIQGKLTDEDYKQTLIPVIEEALKDRQKINVLFQMHFFRGWTAGGTWDDFVNWPKAKSIERMAIVFDGKWDEFMSWIFKSYAFVSHIDIRFFHEERHEEAWEWLRTG